MATTSSPLPRWLEPLDRDRLGRVLSVLSDREAKREHARSATRHADRFGRGVRAMLPSGNKVPHKHQEHFSVEIGSRPQNKYENRYLAIEPFDRTRVDVGGRYLNANWVRELHGGRWWIATQAPLPNTAHTFLSMFLQPDTHPPPSLAPCDSLLGGSRPCRLRTAVQLTLSHEHGRPKAHPYFPDEIGSSYIVPPPDDAPPTTPALRITLEAQEAVPSASCVKSTIRLARCEVPEVGQDSPLYHQATEFDAPVRFTHLLFQEWPDFGVPEGPEEKARLLRFARLVAEVNLQPPPYTPREQPFHPEPPITVNCSAGIGRTGSFIALSSLLRSHGLLIPAYKPSKASDFPPLHPSPLGPLPDDVAQDDVATEIDSLREQRTSMVQKPEQHFLVYELLLAAYREKEAISGSQRD